MIIDMLCNVGFKKANSLDCSYDALINKMDLCGVDKSVVICQSEYIDNDYVKEAVNKYPSRLVGVGMVNPWDKDAEKTLEELFDKGSIKGIKMNCLRFGLSADRQVLMDPLFDIVGKYKGFVIGHGMSDLFSLPVKWAKMAKTHQNVNVLVSHLGSPNMIDESIEAAKNLDNMYFITAGAFPRHIEKAYKELGADKIIFASDGLYGSMEQELYTIRKIITDKQDLEKVLGLNAKKIIGE